MTKSVWLAVLAPLSTSSESHVGPTEMRLPSEANGCAGLGHVLLASASQDKYLRVWRIQPQATSRQPSASSQEAPTDSSVAHDIAR